MPDDTKRLKYHRLWCLQLKPCGHGRKMQEVTQVLNFRMLWLRAIKGCFFSIKAFLCLQIPMFKNPEPELYSGLLWVAFLQVDGTWSWNAHRKELKASAVLYTFFFLFVFSKLIIYLRYIVSYKLNFKSAIMDKCGIQICKNTTIVWCKKCVISFKNEKKSILIHIFCQKKNNEAT